MLFCSYYIILFMDIMTDYPPKSTTYPPKEQTVSVYLAYVGTRSYRLLSDELERHI